MFLDTLDVNAAVTKKLYLSDTWRVNTSDTNFTYLDANTALPVEFEATGYDSSIYDYAFFYRYFGISTLFTPDKDHYAYRIVFEPNNLSYSGYGYNWLRYVVGTTGEIGGGTGVYGGLFSSSSSPNVWYVTDGSDLPVRAAVMGYFYMGAGSNCSISLSASINYTVYSYTKEEYASAIKDSIDDGNDLIEEGNKLQEDANKLQKEENETSKGILSSITDFFSSFFDNLINSIISIFVPSSEEMGALFDRLNQFFSDTFGFLYYPFEFLIQAFDVFIGSSTDVPSLTFPEFSIMGYKVWDSQAVTFEDNEIALNLFSSIRMVSGVILSFAFVNYLRVFFDKRFGGGGS